MSSLRDFAHRDAIAARLAEGHAFTESIATENVCGECGGHRDYHSAGVSVSAEEIIAAAEPDVVAAVETADVRLPYNPTTGKEYQGGNILRLVTVECERGYGSGGWAGYGQWQGVGRQVRKGEKSTIIATVGTKKDDQGNVSTFPGKPRRVFHFDQTEPIEVTQ